MPILQKKCCTTGKKALAYRGKGGQNTGTGFPALRLGVVLYLLISAGFDLWDLLFPFKVPVCQTKKKRKKTKKQRGNENRAHAKGVVLCERACFCLLSAF